MKCCETLQSIEMESQQTRDYKFAKVEENTENGT